MLAASLSEPLLFVKKKSTVTFILSHVLAHLNIFMSSFFILTIYLPFMTIVVCSLTCLQVKISKIDEGKIVNIFLCISFKICFGCSKEPSY